MTKVDPNLLAARFPSYECEWSWPMSQLIARAAGCSIADEIDRPWMFPDSPRCGHPAIAFNGALLARNRAEVMDALVGGYENWQRVGRWGASAMRFHRQLPPAGRAAVDCSFTATGSTSKGHALARFAFEMRELPSGEPLADGWMLLFLLGCGSDRLGRLAAPHLRMPERPPDAIVAHETPVNVTFDWAMPANDWNTTHFVARPENPAPLVHGPRNMSLVLHDAARLYAAGAIERVCVLDLGGLPAPHYPGEPTETLLWSEADGRILARLRVPGGRRIDGGAGDKIVIDQIEIRFA